MCEKLIARADFFYRNKKYKQALVLYEKSQRVNIDYFKLNAIEEYLWCAYIVKINTEDSFSIENLDETKKYIKYILANSSNKDRVFQYTVLKVLKYFKRKTIFEAEKINIWLEKLNPMYLRDEPYTFIGSDNKKRIMSHREEWYDLMFKVSKYLKKYEECLEICESFFKYIDNSENKVDWIKRQKYILGEIDKIDELGESVKHNVFGYGKVVSVDNNIVSVKFDNDKRVMFNLDSVKKEDIIRFMDKKDFLDDLSLNKLKILSNEKADSNEYDEDSIKLNRKIIARDINDKKYLIRLARSYKKLDKVDEAIECYRSVSKQDPSNNEAKDYIEIYKESYIKHYKEKPFFGVHREVGKPIPEKYIMEHWKEELGKFFNKADKDKK